MVGEIKRFFYFPIAYYFKFFAKIQLGIWKPRVIVVTGSSGKTTLLHLIESQLQTKAKYSHQANSSYGIPFDILGLKRKTLMPDEWFYLFILAPFKAFKTPPKEKIYVVEADCDRPGEGRFLATLLKPEITLWISSSLTHSMNFDNLNFPSVEEAIAYEFGYFLQLTQKLCIVNGDSSLIQKQIKRTNIPVKTITKKLLNFYEVFKDHTEFNIDNKKYSFNFLLPKDTFYSIQMTLALMDFLKVEPDYSFSKFSLTPGRCTLFKGIKDTTIIDSSYNATPDALRTILEMFDQYPAQNKWLVLGDMIELGNEEKEEHEKIGDIIKKMKLEKIILVGPRVSKYTYPAIEQSNNLPRRQAGRTVVNFLMPKDALTYLETNLKSGETILFKGARFLEGIIEHLLANKQDVNKLCRQEKVWKERRRQWGL